MNATPDFLLKGSYYALFQCGRFVTSALTLYNAGDYATAVGLAALAHEELGRYLYLREQWENVSKGQTVTVEWVRKYCENHLHKQEWGQGDTSFSDKAITKLVMDSSQALPGSEEQQAAEKKLEALIKKKRRRIPHDRDNKRMKVWYVEPNASGMDWNKPWEQDKEEAKQFIQAACNAYSRGWVKFENLEFLRASNKEFAHAIEAWTDRPTLPPRSSFIRLEF
jgi:AbiV family abortive infection protein